jgi:uncharacterized membrane protein
MVQQRTDRTLPPVELLERYERVAKGSSTELIKLIKEEQEHRHKLQRRYLISYRMGQIFSLLFNVYLVTLIAKIYLLSEKGSIALYSAIGFYILFLLIAIMESKSDRKALTLKTLQNQRNYERRPQRRDSSYDNRRRNPHQNQRERR